VQIDLSHDPGSRVSHFVGTAGLAQ